MYARCAVYSESYKMIMIFFFNLAGNFFANLYPHKPKMKKLDKVDAKILNLQIYKFIRRNMSIIGASMPKF